MTAALYATIWIALALFVAGEAGKRSGQPGIARRYAWAFWFSGALLCALHIAIAFAERHGWSHDAAVRETARQTAAVYGIDWNGAIYVNYLFVAVWAIEAWWWRTRPAEYFARPRSLTWGLRIFYLVVIANAAVIFAGTPGRVAGIPLVAALVWQWRPQPGAAALSRR
jgi:hypothetical protein